jgi:hypothetical protein
MLWFLKYFRQKFLQKNWRFWLKTKLNFEKVYHNIGFWEKRQFCRRKLGKIAENCDHNIDFQNADLQNVAKIDNVDFFALSWQTPQVD